MSVLGESPLGEGALGEAGPAIVDRTPDTKYLVMVPPRDYGVTKLVDTNVVVSVE